MRKISLFIYIILPESMLQTKSHTCQGLAVQAALVSEKRGYGHENGDESKLDFLI